LADLPKILMTFRGLADINEALPAFGYACLIIGGHSLEA
jgi:hypothetical protein